MGKTLVGKNTNNRKENEVRTVRGKELSYVQWAWREVLVSHEVHVENEGCEAETPRFVVGCGSNQQ